LRVEVQNHLDERVDLAPFEIVGGELDRDLWKRPVEQLYRSGDDLNFRQASIMDHRAPPLHS
jgi:hypothetical protein